MANASRTGQRHEWTATMSSIWHEDGVQHRDLCFVEDVARANLLAATTDFLDGLAVNVGSGVGSSASLGSSTLLGPRPGLHAYTIEISPSRTKKTTTRLFGDRLHRAHAWLARSRQAGDPRDQAAAGGSASGSGTQKRVSRSFLSLCAARADESHACDEDRGPERRPPPVKPRERRDG